MKRKCNWFAVDELTVKRKKERRRRKQALKGIALLLLRSSSSMLKGLLRFLEGGNIIIN